MKNFDVQFETTGWVDGRKNLDKIDTELSESFLGGFNEQSQQECAFNDGVIAVKGACISEDDSNHGSDIKVVVMITLSLQAASQVAAEATCIPKDILTKLSDAMGVIDGECLLNLDDCWYVSDIWGVEDPEYPNFQDFSQADRYAEAVETSLVTALPIAEYRPEAMRVTRRHAPGRNIGAVHTWFEVETYQANSNKWICQKSHPTKEGAVADAVGWYTKPDPVASAGMK